ncbi:protein of unknown function [Caloramator quimbayensis]|uniref:DUF4364 domain-containing protein n=1 Tax=Caloramator quimbayensis TaxID=1147123 RepID=A0A1T4XJF8_9CLOT|nr:DUF4364 family protein [Caloramator quimbayensis]SKA89245.1 protein of unknown function [Caloramator quimbayensis]
MFKDSAELAENKLLILYILNNINMPISNSDITHIILENNLINYFALQQYLSELIESNFIRDEKADKRHSLSITKEGKKTLDLFINRIPDKKKHIIDEYINRHLNEIKKEVESIAEYLPYLNDKFIVNLKLKEGDKLLIELKITADSNSEANNICKKWKNNSSELYEKIINTIKS